MTPRPVMSFIDHWLLYLVAQVLLGGPLLAQDLSMLSDFGISDFSHESAQIIQIGNSNKAQISQSHDFGGALGNYAEINQDGSENDASIAQLGDLNNARISQNGDSNIAYITQFGNANTADIVQTGGNNVLYASQTGNYNSIVSLQQGSATANLTQIGDHNVINTNQLVGATLSIRQEGNNLTASVRQN